MRSRFVLSSHLPSQKWRDRFAPIGVRRHGRRRLYCFVTSGDSRDPPECRSPHRGTLSVHCLEAMISDGPKLLLTGFEPLGLLPCERRLLAPFEMNER